VVFLRDHVASHMVSGDPVTILIAESFAPVRVRLAAALRARGFETVETVDAVDVARVLSKQIPSSFVVSAGLNGGKGLDLVRCISTMEKTKGKPKVVVLDEGDRAEDMELLTGLDSVVTVKRSADLDIFSQDVVGAIEKALPGLKKSPSAAAEPAPGGNGGRTRDCAAFSQDTSDRMGVAFEFYERVVRMVKDNQLPGPILPEMLNDALTVFANPNVSFEDVVRLVKKHQMLALRLLSVANSAFYACAGGRVTTIDGAMARVGINGARQFVEAAATKAFLLGKDPALRALIARRLEASCLVAMVCDRLASSARYIQSEVYAVGLLHNIGQTFLLYTLALLQERGQRVKYDEASLEVMLANRAASLNSLVCRALPLPADVGMVFVAQERCSPVVAFVHQSMWIADRIQGGMAPADLALDTEAELLGLTAPALESLRKDLVQIVELMRSDAS
jgi:HD-like signal output (HDOD) protein